MINEKVIIFTSPDGNVDIKIDSSNRMKTITSLSAAMCGAFNLAGEHEKEVLSTISKIALQQLHDYGDDSLLSESDFQ